jgi:hypothetical protein
MNARTSPELRALRAAVAAREAADARLMLAAWNYARAETLALSRRLRNRRVTFSSGMGSTSLEIEARNARPFGFDGAGAYCSRTIAPAFLGTLATIESDCKLPDIAAGFIAARNGKAEL